jgi:hypothetical protein
MSTLHDRTRCPQCPPERPRETDRERVRRQIRACEAGLAEASAAVRTHDYALADLERLADDDGVGLVEELQARRLQAAATVEANELKLEHLRELQQRIVARTPAPAPSGLRLAFERMLVGDNHLAAA